ncbi:hypothetical protein BHU11_02065 [Tannerella sp. oral taxon 808]|nr:hypothetical protein BHU11_02065 [Tannerella sp. oral taxon 808]
MHQKMLFFTCFGATLPSTFFVFIQLLERLISDKLSLVCSLMKRLSAAYILRMSPIAQIFSNFSVRKNVFTPSLQHLTSSVIIAMRSILPMLLF